MKFNRVVSGLCQGLALVAALLAAPTQARDLAEIKAEGVLRHIGIPYANFVSGSGDGMDVELIKGFALHLQVDDADEWWNRALTAGAVPLMPLADQFWGDRYGRVMDPFGHTWSIAAPIRT